MFTGTPKLNQEFLEELANLEFQESLLAAVSRGDLKKYPQPDQEGLPAAVSRGHPLVLPAQPGTPGRVCQPGIPGTLARCGKWVFSLLMIPGVCRLLPLQRAGVKLL